MNSVIVFFGVCVVKYIQMAESNPNGSNQYQLDPRQKLCWELYINPDSATFSNALQSALKAGYEQSYSEQITTRPWFLEKVRSSNMVSKAEKVLEKTLNYETEDAEGNVKVDLLRVQTGVATTIVTTLGKDKGYSTRSEFTGKDGGAIIIDDKTKETSNSLIGSYLASTSNPESTGQ